MPEKTPKIEDSQIDVVDLSKKAVEFPELLATDELLELDQATQELFKSREGI
jgi:hypothetical protein